MLNDTNRVFAESLKFLMADRNVSYRKISKATGVPVSSLHGYAHCTTGIPLPAAKTISAYFGVTVDWMLERGNMLQKKDVI